MKNNQIIRRRLTCVFLIDTTTNERKQAGPVAYSREIMPVLYACFHHGIWRKYQESLQKAVRGIDKGFPIWKRYC